MSDQVKVGDETVSLADLAGLNIDDFAEKRGFGLPRGVFHFIVSKGEFTAVGDPAKPVAKFTCPVRRVLELAESEGVNVDELVNKEHIETFFITSPEDDIGRIKAFLADIGASAQGLSLKAAIENSVGCEFTGQIKRIKDKKDPDREYVNLNRDKIKAVQRGSVAA